MNGNDGKKTFDAHEILIQSIGDSQLIVFMFSIDGIFELFVFQLTVSSIPQDGQGKSSEYSRHEDKVAQWMPQLPPFRRHNCSHVTLEHENMYVLAEKLSMYVEWSSHQSNSERMTR